MCFKELVIKVSVIFRNTAVGTDCLTKMILWNTLGLTLKTIDSEDVKTSVTITNILIHLKTSLIQTMNVSKHQLILSGPNTVYCMKNSSKRHRSGMVG